MIVYIPETNKILEFNFYGNDYGLDYIEITSEHGTIKTDGRKSAISLMNIILDQIGNEEIIILEEG